MLKATTNFKIHQNLFKYWFTLWNGWPCSPRKHRLYLPMWSNWKLVVKETHTYYSPIFNIHIPYARHYNPRFVYFLPTFWKSKTFFQRVFFRKFCPYVWLVFKSGFWSRAGYSGACTVPDLSCCIKYSQISPWNKFLKMKTHFKGLDMKNLQYEITICQKIIIKTQEHMSFGSIFMHQTLFSWFVVSQASKFLEHI
jgi:hypothetical protein